MEKLKLKEIIVDQNNIRKKELIIDRTILEKLKNYIKSPFTIIISGIRRCGKSTLLSEIRKKYPGYFINFDDERLLSFEVNDFQKLNEIFIELYGKENIFYFDEIQNIDKWERFVRRLHDEGMKVIITGSNASMLSKELGTHLTGRHISINLYPFSFKEFLIYKNYKLKKDSFYSTEEKIKIKKYFEEYLFEGGFPEYLKTRNREYLKTLYDNIIYRDIIVRYKINNEKAFKELTSLAINSIGKEISFNSVKKLLGLGSSTTVKEYFDFLENSFLIFLIPRYDFSLKKQIQYNKKVYVIDSAFSNYIGFSFSENIGRILENTVFIELKRRNKEIFYHKQKKECDFVIREKTKIKQAIQVCYEINNDNQEREIKGLVEALEMFNLKQGLILTNDQTDEIKINNIRIIVMPVWKWLLEK